MEREEGSRGAGARVSPENDVVLWDGEEEQVLHLPQRVGGGEPENGGGHLHGVRARAAQGALREAV